MFRKPYALIVCTIISWASICDAQTVIFGPVESPVNGHFYSVLSSSNWTDAQNASQLLGGSLVTIRSAEEELWIIETFSAYPFLWLGLYDPSQQFALGPAHADKFEWVSGETASYRNWASQEPNNFNGGEYWTQLVLTDSSTVPVGKWNDIYNSANPVHTPNSYGPVYGLVEVVPEPVSSISMGVGALILLSRRRSQRR